MIDPIIISSEESGQTLISFLKRKFKKTPISIFYKLVRTKKLLINQQSQNISFSQKLEKKDSIFITDYKIYDKIDFREETKKKILKTQEYKKITIPIIFEDKNILITWKKNNITTEETNEKVKIYLLQTNRESYLDLLEKNFSLTAAHRLDKLVSGLIIYPKNFIAQKVIYEAFKNKKKKGIIRNYIAVCKCLTLNSFLFKNRIIKGFITKNEKEQKMMFSLNIINNKYSKSCLMLIDDIIKKDEKTAILSIASYTGRKHQIRSAFSFFGFPILGDYKYGGDDKKRDKIKLFANKLSFNNIPFPLNYLNGKIIEINKKSQQNKSYLKNMRLYE